MTFGDLYRDIYSRLSLDGEDHDIYFDDISKAINDAIREVRVNYIKEGMGHEFATTETLNSFTQSTKYPYLNEDTLSNKIMQDLPIEYTVLSSNCYATENEIYDSTQIYDKGDIARRGTKLYECVESFNGVNTYDRYFNPDDVRNYYPSNGLKYNSGDIVYDVKSGSYYKVTTGFTNTYSQSADNVSELDKLYWKEIGDAYLYVSHYSFEFVNALKINDDIDGSEAISILNDTVYATSSIQELNITYIPKWTSVTSLDATLNLPDFMIPQVKDRALVRIGQKLNVEIQLAENEDDG